MKFILNLLVTTTLCLLLTMCKKDPQKEPAAICQYDSSVEGMKEWYYYKTGTWWVYQEQTTRELDTIIVYYDWAGTNSSGTVGFEWYCRSSYDDFNYKYRFNSSYSIHCLSTEECTCHKVDRSKTRPGNFVGSGKIFLYPMIEGNYSYLLSSNATQGGQTTLITLSDSISILGKTYYDVARWRVFPDTSEDDQTMIYVIAKNYGIVQKKNLTQNTDWILIDSGIIQ